MGDGMGLGWLWGHGREAGAPFLAHSNWEQLWQLCPFTWERSPQHHRRGGSAGATLTPHHSLPAMAPGQGRGAGWEAQARLRREQDPGSTHPMPVLKAGWHERPGMEQQQFPTARQEHHGHTGDWPGGTPSTCHHPVHSRREEQECPALEAWDAELPGHPLRRPHRCGGPASAGQELWSVGSPARVRSSPTVPPASPPLLRTHKGPTPQRPAPGRWHNPRRSKAPKASL